MGIARCTSRWWLLLIASLALLLLGWPTAALADGPFADPTYQPPQGGGAAAPAPAHPAPDLPPTYAELPVFSTAPAPARLPAGQPLRQDGGGDPADPSTWYDLLFNPGKWAMDSVLGAISAFLYSVSSMFSALGLWAFGGPDTGAEGYVAANGIIFMTPPHLTIDSRGTMFALDLVLRAAYGFLALVATYRLLRLFAAEDKGTAAVTFVWQMGVAVVLILGAAPMCAWLVDVANTLSGVVLYEYTYADELGALVTPFLPPADEGASQLSVVLALATLLYYAVLAWLAVLALGRLVLVNLLIIVSPLLGLSIATGGWNYGQVWFFRFVEVLVTPILWGLAIGMARQFMTDVALGLDPTISYLLGAYMLWIVPKVTLLVGLASREAVSRINVTTIIVAARALARLGR